MDHIRTLHNIQQQKSITLWLHHSKTVWWPLAVLIQHTSKRRMDKWMDILCTVLQ